MIPPDLSDRLGSNLPWMHGCGTGRILDSMGTIAARDCLGIVKLSERVAAILLLAAVQGVDLRGAAACSPPSAALREAVRAEVPTLSEDRRQDLDIERVVGLHRTGALPCPPPADVRPSDA